MRERLQKMMGKTTEREAKKAVNQKRVDVLNACVGARLKVEKSKEEWVNTLLETLKNLMDSMGLTAEQSMDAMGVPKREREVLASLL